MNYFDEPDANDDTVAMEPLDSVQSNEYNNNTNEDNLSTPINTYSFFDEPDSSVNNSNNTHLPVHQESSASPPPPSATLSNGDNASAKPVEVIPEDTEKDEYRDEDDDDDDDEEEEEEEEDNMARLEADLEAIRTKLEAIKIENMVFSEEMGNSAEHTSLMDEYDSKIMEYDNEFHEQQRFIEEEERLIQEYQQEFEEKISKYDIDDSSIKENNNSDINGIIRNGQSKHSQKSSIVLYDNSFAINHQLQLEIDKLTNQIEYLQTSKIELVKNTANEVDRLRSIIKQFQAK